MTLAMIVRAILTAAGADIDAIPSDKEGMDIIYGAKHHKTAKLIYTTPSHQFPLGTTQLTTAFSIIRLGTTKQMFLRMTTIVNFAFYQNPIQALQGLDNHQRVIYAGTFSKMMYPGFRLGF